MHNNNNKILISFFYSREERLVVGPSDAIMNEQHFCTMMMMLSHNRYLWLVVTNALGSIVDFKKQFVDSTFLYPDTLG